MPEGHGRWMGAGWALDSRYAPIGGRFRPGGMLRKSPWAGNNGKKKSRRVPQPAASWTAARVRGDRVGQRPLPLRRRLPAAVVIHHAAARAVAMMPAVVRAHLAAIEACK